MSIDNQLKEMYLDYVNNFLTVSAFASAYFVNEDEARDLIKIGKRLHEEEAQRLCYLCKVRNAYNKQSKRF